MSLRSVGVVEVVGPHPEQPERVVVQKSGEDDVRVVDPGALRPLVDAHSAAQLLDAAVGLVPDVDERHLGSRAFLYRTALRKNDLAELAGLYRAVRFHPFADYPEERYGLLLADVVVSELTTVLGKAADEVRRELETLKLPGEEAESLLASIYENPHDDSRRLIYSDWLSERGDPLGEYIALQFRGAAPNRQKALFAQGVREWLKPFRRAIAMPVFEKGFLTSCRLRIVPAEISAAWGTIKRIDCGSIEGDLGFLGRFFASPHLRALEVVTKLGPLALPELTQHASDIRFSSLEVPLRDSTLDALTTLAVPSIESLSLTRQDYRVELSLDTVANLPQARHLKKISIASPLFVLELGSVQRQFDQLVFRGPAEAEGIARLVEEMSNLTAPINIVHVKTPETSPPSASAFESLRDQVGSQKDVHALLINGRVV